MGSSFTDFTCLHFLFANGRASPKIRSLSPSQDILAARDLDCVPPYVDRVHFSTPDGSAAIDPAGAMDLIALLDQNLFACTETSLFDKKRDETP